MGDGLIDQEEGSESDVQGMGMGSQKSVTGRKKRSIQCCEPKCNESFSTYDDYLRHKDENHSICMKTSCNEHFENKKELRKHLRETDHRMVPCWDCHEYSQNYQELKKHRKEYHPFPCKCKKRFAFASSLKEHLKSNNDELTHKRMFECWMCQKLFEDYDALKHHLETVHQAYPL